MPYACVGMPTTLAAESFSMQPKRKSQRKQDFDYSLPDYYAVTACTQNRSCLFGVIGNGDMFGNFAGSNLNLKL